ncbi:MAG: hypothetical protein LBL52_01730 [Rickettsiales bacterium]|jgi:hypothetical protein|nr:hypothetical protein [Rickettsiales bacterium]
MTVENPLVPNEDLNDRYQNLKFETTKKVREAFTDVICSFVIPMLVIGGSVFILIIVGLAIYLNWNSPDTLIKAVLWVLSYCLPFVLGLYFPKDK